jgi:hypothetical protein
LVRNAVGKAAADAKPPLRDVIEAAAPLLLSSPGRQHAGAKEEQAMPRYMVERTFPEGLHIPANADGAEALGGVVDRNASEGVSWVHSYVTPDKTRTFCVYDAPDEQAIRSVAEKNRVPVDAIHEVRVLDPYFYH